MYEPRRLAAPLALLLLVGAVYSNSLGAGYTLDSAAILAADPRLESASARNLRDIFTRNYWWPRFESDLYRPLTTLSYLLNVRLAGGDRAVVWPLHAGNLALHAGNALLVLGLGRRVLGSGGRAFLLAAVFAAHPLATENVTNLVGRADLLAALFVLLGLRAHARLRDGTPRRGLALAALAASALLGVFCKESAVVLFGLVALYDLCLPAAPAGGARLVDWRGLWRTVRRGGFASYAAIAPALLLLALARHAVLGDSPVFAQRGSDNPIAAADATTGRITALGLVGDYLRLALWPAELSCDYSHAQIPLFGWSLASPRDLRTLALIAGLLALVVTTLRLGRHNRALLFFAGFFAVTFLPASNLLFPVGTIFAERFMYLPLVGVVGALLAAPVPWVLERARRLWPGRGRSIDAAAALAGAAVVGALGARAFARNFDWRDDVALWTAASRVAPDSYKAWNGLANALLAAGGERADLEAALQHLRRAQAVFEERPLPLIHLPARLYADLALVALRLGDRATLAAGLVPPAPNPAGEPRYREAYAAILEAVEIDAASNAASRRSRLERGAAPEEITDVGDFELHLTHGHVAARLGRDAEALSAFAWARRIEPARVEPHLTLAQYHRALGRLRPAGVLYLETLVLAPDREDLWRVLGDVYRKLDPSAPAVRTAGGSASPNLDHPLVRSDLREALLDLTRLLVGARRFADAELVAELGASRFGVERASFDEILDAARARPQPGERRGS
jgi:tetratricopeptide (TPR) repeat protein